jgi:hypothetical protein
MKREQCSFVYMGIVIAERTYSRAPARITHLFSIVMHLRICAHLVQFE